MGLLARGSVTDRPWGMTLGALGMRGLTGQLTLGGQYKVAFQQGAVVGAFSPLANDAAVRLALTGNLITSSQVGDITRRLAAAPQRDEIDVLAEACRLQPDQAQRLRRRLVAQRAARTFAIDQGEFVVEDEITVAVVPGSELDVRAIVFLGARNNLSEDRLSTEIAQLGVWFQLKPETVGDLPQYGFTEDERPVLQMLVQGANLADIEQANVALGARTVRAVAYAVAACGACQTSATPVGGSPRTVTTSNPAPNQSRTSTVLPHHARTSTIPPNTRASGGSQPPRTAPVQASGQDGAPTTQAPAPSQTVLRGAAAPQPTAPPDVKHKTAPLGSRPPVTSTTPPRAVGSNPPETTGRVPTHGSNAPETQPATGRVPTQGSNPPAIGPTGSGSGAHPAVGRVPTPGDADTYDPPTHRVPFRDSRTMPPQGRAPTPGEPPRGRSPTGYPMSGRSPTGDPASGRTPTGSPTPSDQPQYGRPPTGHPSMGRVPTPGATAGLEAPRTITQSSGVPREAGDRGSSGANASTTGTFRAQGDRSPSGGVRRPGSQTNSPLASRTRTGSSGLHPRPTSDGVARPRTSSSSQMFALNPPTQRPGGKPSVRRKQSTAATMEIEALIEKKIPMLDQGVDYFTLFGLPIGASPEDVRSTYLMLARKLHPDRLAAIGIEDDGRHAQRLMACINEAFAVLNDPIRRAEYMSILDRGGEAAVRAENQQADELAMKVMRAEEAFRQGEMCMRREQIAQAIVHFKEAVELQPAEPEYQALLAWAQFAHATDKTDVATMTRKALMRAGEMNLDSPTARFYLGRVERMLGREKEALYWFYEVLKLKPNHSEARSEARILEQRLKAKR